MQRPWGRTGPEFLAGQLGARATAAEQVRGTGDGTWQVVQSLWALERSRAFPIDLSLV